MFAVKSTTLRRYNMLLGWRARTYGSDPIGNFGVETSIIASLAPLDFNAAKESTCFRGVDSVIDLMGTALVCSWCIRGHSSPDWAIVQLYCAWHSPWE